MKRDIRDVRMSWLPRIWNPMDEQYDVCMETHQMQCRCLLPCLGFVEGVADLCNYPDVQVAKSVSDLFMVEAEQNSYYNTTGMTPMNAGRLCGLITCVARCAFNYGCARHTQDKCRTMLKTLARVQVCDLDCSQTYTLVEKLLTVSAGLVSLASMYSVLRRTARRYLVTDIVGLANAGNRPIATKERR